MPRAWVAFLILSSLCAAEERVEPPSPLFQLVGVCPSPDDPARAAIVWHMEAPDVAPAVATSVFKQLEGPTLNACLLAIIDRDPEVDALLDAYLRRGPEAPSYPMTINAVFGAWVAAGFDGVLAEVARDGEPGPKVAAFLGTC